MQTEIFSQYFTKSLKALILTNNYSIFHPKRNQAANSHNTAVNKAGKIENPAPIAGPSCKFLKSQSWIYLFYLIFFKVHTYS